MGFDAGEQTERGFQKQVCRCSTHVPTHLPTHFLLQGNVFPATKRTITSKFQKNSKGNLRQWKNVGLGFKTPKSAVEATYVDKKCPWTGNVSIRGRILRGVIKSTKMHRTIVVRRDYLHWVTKYQRYEKRHMNFSAHCSPAFLVKRV